MKAQKGCHHNNVATYTNKVTYFIDEKEPFVDISENEKQNIMREMIKFTVEFLHCLFQLTFKFFLNVLDLQSVEAYSNK